MQWPPNYVEVFEWRQYQLAMMKTDKKFLAGAILYYKEVDHCVDFITQWCDTYDPRNASTDQPVKMPMVLFPRQRDLIEFVLLLIQNDCDGLVEKCRDMGATWVLVFVSVWAWLFLPGVSIGWGSRKEQLVDKLGDPDSIFEKIRMTILQLPEEFLPAGFDPKVHLTYMRVINPETMSTITGEAGDNIGRGGRKKFVVKDESAHYEHPEKIEAALTDNTRCQIDISSVTGPGTVFHRKREAGIDWLPGQGVIKGKTNVFVMDWRDHPAKDQAWYDRRRTKAVSDGLLHVFAQEVDRNYAAAVDGVVIPAEWVVAAIDAHIVLGIKDSGAWGAALDVADEGLDTNALAKRKGIVLKSVDEWGERDTGMTTRRAINHILDCGPIELQYDSVGVGAGVKAEANRLVDEKLMPKHVRLVAWSAGASVLEPERRVIPGDRDSPINEDFYENLKAQAWWQARRRFENTYRAVRSKAADATPTEKKFTWDESELISLDSTMPLLHKARKELSQAVMTKSKRLKLLIDKQPEGTKSPNIADAIIMCFWPVPSKKPMFISSELVAKSAQR